MWFQLFSLVLWMTDLEGADEPQGGATKPVIRYPPTDTYSAEGVLEFVCQADGVPKPIIQWYDATTGRAVIDRVPTSGSTSGIHVNQHYGRLMISNPTRDTIYTFYCNASNSAGWTISQPPVKGGLAYLDSSFLQVPLDKTVHEGDRVLLECVPPKGVPKPYVLWLHDGKPVAVQGRSPQLENLTIPVRPFIQITEQGGLRFDAIRRADAGSYICVTGNTAGRMQSPSAKLIIQPRVRFIETPKDVRVRQGADVQFRCRIEGNQLVQWGKGQDGSGIIDHTRTELAEGYLLLKNVQPSDAGVYVCTAPGAIAADALLTVETPPTFSRTPDDLTVREGEIAVFHCITNGYPKPSIYWELPDKTPIFPSDHLTAVSTNRRFYLHNDGRLEITNVKPSDAGKYQCTAHSSIDRIHSSAMLHVIPDSQSVLGSQISGGKHPKLKDTTGNSYYPLAPIIGLPPANQTRAVGDVVTLDCELSISQTSGGSHIHNQPIKMESTEWTVSWYRNTLSTGHNTELLNFAKERRYSLLPGGSLQIVDLQLNDAGSYTCSARAFIHIDSSNYRSPILLQSNWTAFLNTVKRGTIVKLDYGQDNPLSPPRNLHVTNYTDTTVTLAWDSANWIDPAMNSRDFVDRVDGPPSSITYWVEFYRADRPLEGWKTVEQNWQANTVKIGGLESNTVYYFLIRPRWSYGRIGWASPPVGPVLTSSTTSTASQSIQTRAHITDGLTNMDLVAIIERVEVRSLKLYALTPRHLRVSWTVEESPSVLHLINGYTIYYREASLLRCIAANLDLLSSDHTAANAERENAYCSLKIEQDESKSQLYIRLQEFQRLRAIAPQTSDSQTTRMRSVSVKAEFVPTDNQLHQIHPVIFEGSGLLRDLEPFRCYEVSVKSHLTNGLLGKVEGRESVAQTVLTFESFPSLPPERIAAVWISSTEVQLTWAPPPPAAWNGLLTGYASYVYDEFAHNYQTFNTTINSERIIRIRGLSSPNTYIVQMAAVTCKGVGLRSQPLKLLPELRFVGLGVGWGFDEKTGLPENENTRSDQTSQGEHSSPLIQQPWFITIMVISVLLWIIFTAMIVCCCRRQRHALRKSAGAVLITSNLHSVTGDGVNRPIINGSIDGRRQDRFFKEMNHVQLEPLIPSSLIKTDSEPFGNLPATTTTSISNNQVRTTTDGPNGYGVYSVTQGENGRSQWTPINRASMYPLAASLMDSGGFAAYDSNCALLSGCQTMSPHIAQNYDYNPSTLQGLRPMPVPNTTNHYPSTATTQSPTYLTYQSQMVPLSQSIMEFQNPNALADRQLPYCPNTTATGLPPIAPVAQLGSHMLVMGRATPPSGLESVGSFGSVAPYATASIIQNVFPPEAKSYPREDEKPVNPVCNQDMLRNHSGSHSHSSASEGSSYSNKRIPIGDNIPDRRGMMSPARLNGLSSEQNSHNWSDLSESQARSFTPATRTNYHVTSSTQNTLSATSNSESTASTTTQQSEDKQLQLRNRSPGSATQGKSNSRPSGNLICTTQSENSAADSVYSFADECIPPPPASPPPPAPTKSTLLMYPNTSHRQTDAEHYPMSDSCGSRIVESRGPPRIPEEVTETQPAVYDMNAETTDDESDSTCSHRMPTNKHPQQYHFTVIKDHLTGPGVQPFDASFHVPLAADEPQSSTYAQVY